MTKTNLFKGLWIIEHNTRKRTASPPMTKKTPPKKGSKKKKAEPSEFSEQEESGSKAAEETTVLIEEESMTDREETIPIIKKATETPTPGGDDLYAYEIKIPKERIAVLIGKEGVIKRHIERELDAKIEVDSSEGDVTILGKDALTLLTGREIIRAVARGFNPDIAMLLLKPDYTLDIMNLADAARTPNDLARLKGRIIGAGGKSRRVIEELTETNISVYGKTVGIIAEVDSLMIARRAIEMLVEGSAHRNVYKWLEKQRKTMRMRRGFGEERHGF